MDNESHRSIEHFLDALASKSATPGGGSVVALMGAMAAALVSMVANLTLGKKDYLDVSDEMRALEEKAAALRCRILGMMEKDMAAFAAVMHAYGLPRETPMEKQARSEAIQEGLKLATQVPMICAGLCKDVIGLCAIAADKGNRNVISDAGVGVLAAQAAFRSAVLNVHVNTNALRDAAYVKETLEKLEALSFNLDAEVEAIFQRVMSRL